MTRSAPSDRFAELIRRQDPPLDETALVLAGHAYDDLDVDAQLARLDDLGGRCQRSSLADLNRVLFVDFGLRPNTAEYYDPRNSFLNEVLDRRVGIPISLAIVMMEVGRRAGIELRGVGMPGHFIVTDGATFLDPFAGGVAVEVRDPVAPSGNHAILYRMLNNLRSIYTANRDLESLRWVLRLRTLFPGAPASDHHEHTRAVARLN